MLAVVPARGGSKGLPGKNTRALAGRPLIVHTLEAARAARLIDRILVTTDDDAIASAAGAVPGVEVPFSRPAHLADDGASAVDVYLHVADWLLAHEGAAPEALCVLLPTSPLRRPADIDAAITLFAARDADVVLSVAPIKPLAWQQRVAADGRMAPVIANPSMANRQDIAPTWALNGSIYVLDVAALRRTRSYFGAHTYGYVMPPERSVDIDDIHDFTIAEALIAHGAERQREAREPLAAIAADAHDPQPAVASAVAS